MGILTILKANIFKKKGTFISIVILILLITGLMISILSVKRNYEYGINRAFNDNGEILIDIRRNNLSDELFDRVCNYKDVRKVNKFDTVSNYYTIYNGQKDGNSYFIRELLDNVNIYNKNLSGFVNKTVNKGEIFIPLGLIDKYNCKIGENLKICFNDSIERVYKIAAFVEEPHQGASTIGWKQVFVHKEDLNDLEQIVDEKLLYYTLEVFKSDDCKLSARKFQRELNLNTNIISMSIGSINNDQSINYATMIPNIVIGVAQAFAILLFVIVLIIVNHSISTELEMDYQSLGILKALGYTKNKIRLIYFLQYFIAIILGISLGLVLSILIEGVIRDVCQKVIGTLPDKGIGVGVILLYVLVISLISSVVIYLKTISINKISPIRAINGNNSDVYFKNRLNAPISKRFLSLSLSFRQFSSSIKRYISIIIISIFLFFCMITTTLVGTCLKSRDTLRNMGVSEYDILVSGDSFYDYSKIDEYVESTGEMIEKNSYFTSYVSLNGENVVCEFFKNPEYVSGILKGRRVKNDNEILVTNQLSKELGLKIGDEVSVSFEENSRKYIICGLYQTVSDAGYAFSMSFDGAISNGAKIEKVSRYYLIEDRDKIEDISYGIKEKFSDVTIKYNDSNGSSMFESYSSVVNVINAIIYSFSIIFILIVIRMICVKAFIQEEKMIGIYKSLGFSNTKLRLQFSLRFLIVSFIGTILGAVLSVIFSDDVLNQVFSLFGICKVSLKYTFSIIFIPFIVITVCLFLFSFIISRRIKHLEITSLIAEV